MKRTQKCLECKKIFETKSPYIVYCSCKCQDKHEETNIWVKVNQK
jgi:hypothetical protein